MPETRIEPYLSFNGRCEEAVRYDESTLGANVGALMRYRESPEPLPPGMVPEDWADKIMHAVFEVDGAAIMAADDHSADGSFRGVSLALSVATDEQANRYFSGLADGGKIIMPQGKTFWSPRFGMVVDRFGVSWMIGVDAAAE